VIAAGWIFLAVLVSVWALAIWREAQDVRYSRLEERLRRLERELGFEETGSLAYWQRTR